MALNAIVLAVGSGDTDVLRTDGVSVAFNDDIDLLGPKAGDRESGFHFTLRGEGNAMAAVILGAVDDRVETRKSRRQILGTGDGFNLTARTVGIEADFLFAVYGPSVDIQQNTVDRDVLFLCNLHRFLSCGERVLCQNLNRPVGRKVGHAVCEQKDRARKPV